MHFRILKEAIKISKLIKGVLKKDTIFEWL